MRTSNSSFELINLAIVLFFVFSLSADRMLNVCKPKMKQNNSVSHKTTGQSQNTNTRSFCTTTMQCSRPERYCSLPSIHKASSRITSTFWSWGSFIIFPMRILLPLVNNSSMPIYIRTGNLQYRADRFNHSTPEFGCCPLRALQRYRSCHWVGLGQGQPADQIVNSRCNESDTIVVEVLVIRLIAGKFAFEWNQQLYLSMNLIGK